MAHSGVPRRPTNKSAALYGMERVTSKKHGPCKGKNGELKKRLYFSVGAITVKFLITLY